MAIVRKYGNNIADRDRALAAEGWQKLQVDTVDSTETINGVTVTRTVQNIDGQVLPLSSGACGSVTPNNAYRQTNGSELVTGNFQWTCSTFDNTPQPEDALSLGATDTNNKSLNVPATNASGWVEDTGGTRRDSQIWPSSFNGSSVGYELNDGFINGQWVGKKGGVYFFLDHRPINSGNHYVQMCWEHTWNVASAHISSITVSYPWSLSVSFDTGGVQNWKQCQKAQITYPNG